MNSKFKKLYIVLFFLIATLDVLGIIIDEKMLRLIFKPLIIPALALVYIVYTTGVKRLYLAALFFSFLGDVVLLKSGTNYFMLGLGSFLLAQMIFVVIVKGQINSYQGKDVLLAGVPFTLIFVVIILLIYKSLGDLLLPVLIYGITLCTFGILSFYNYLEKRTNTAVLILLGDFFFIISDGMLAIEKFQLQNRELAIGVMLTYIVAQYLICRHMIKRSESI